MTGYGWTVKEACAEFAAAGFPIDPGRLRLAIRAFEIQSVGETPSTTRGGRGERLYPIADLQRLHAVHAEFLTRRHPAGGDT